MIAKSEDQIKSPAWLKFIIALGTLIMISPSGDILVRRTILLLVSLLLGLTCAYPQAENVPVGHPVYDFLKRLEVRGVIREFDDVVLPLSRHACASLLTVADSNRARLSDVERGRLDDFLSEFRFERTGSIAGMHSLIGSDAPTLGSALERSISDSEKFLHAYSDSAVSFFVNVLLDADIRRASGDNLPGTRAEFLQAGGRIRGTLMGKLGFFAQATNAQFWGSRGLLARDRSIRQSLALGTGDSQNFDFSEGHVRYDAGIASMQIGRGRLLWGTGVDQKMIVSENSPVFDFIRADFGYKALRYTFVHGWLLGTKGGLLLRYPFDSTATFLEPTAADKYFAAHRLGLSFPDVLDFGFQEMYIYSNRSVDLAYLNPLVLLESVQRARGERDNGLWAFDATTKFIRGLELRGTLLFDDIHIPGIFSDKWYDKHALQFSALWMDPFGVSNTSLMVEYTRVEPWVFGHERSRDNTYTNDGSLLGAAIGPNADSWFFRLDWLARRNLYVSGRVLMGRQGKNVYDAAGNLLRNVGGDEMVAHRTTDSETKVFLDGELQKRSRAEVLIVYEFINQCWLDARFLREFVVPAAGDNLTLGSLRLRLEF
jgi:hypothetical protein